MTTSSIEEFKDFPEGSPEKRHYDFHHLPFEAWVKKYYTNPDFKQWNLCLEDVRNALNNRDLFIKQWKSRAEKFDFRKMEDVLSDLRTKKEFEDDILMYISFLAGDGFFKTYNITIEQWYLMKSWAAPGKELNQPTIQYLKSIPFGTNYLRMRLADLNWWRF